MPKNRGSNSENTYDLITLRPFLSSVFHQLPAMVYSAWASTSDSILSVFKAVLALVRTSSMKPDTCVVTLLLAGQTVWALNPHPRIWLDPAELARLTAKKTAKDADWLAVKAEADTYKTYAVTAFARDACPSNSICYTYEGSGWYEAMVRLALVYQVTGDTRARKSVREG